MSETDKLANKIRSSAPFPVYLGGSRRMNELHPKSGVSIQSTTDYDLYATYNTSATKYVEANGFLLIGRSKSTHDPYFDTEIVEIYQHEDHAIQFLMRKDAEFYRKVFEAIPIDYYLKYLWKSSSARPSRDQIMATFNALFAVAHATEGGSPISTPVVPIVRDPIKAYEYAMKGII